MPRKRQKLRNRSIVKRAQQIIEYRFFLFDFVCYSARFLSQFFLGSKKSSAPNPNLSSGTAVSTTTRFLAEGGERRQESWDQRDNIFSLHELPPLQRCLCFLWLLQLFRVNFARGRKWLQDNSQQRWGGHRRPRSRLPLRFRSRWRRELHRRLDICSIQSWLRMRGRNRR